MELHTFWTVLERQCDSLYILHSAGAFPLLLHSPAYQAFDMSITRQLLNEFRPLFRMLEEPLGGRFGAYGLPSRSVLDDPFFASPRFARPAVDVSEDGDNYVVETELPGVKKEDMEVRVGDGGRSVTIEGKIMHRGSYDGGNGTSASVSDTQGADGSVEGKYALRIQGTQ